MNVSQMIDAVKPTADYISVGITGTAVASWIFDYGFPGAATVLSVVWLAIRVWETETVKKWTHRWEDK